MLTSDLLNYLNTIAVIELVLHLSFLLYTLNDPLQALIQSESFVNIKIGIQCENLRNYPSPVNAQHAWMCHWCFLIDVKSSCLEISAADIDPFKSFGQFRTLWNCYEQKRKTNLFIGVN